MARPTVAACVKPASPQALALAEIGGLLLDAALAGLLLFALIDRIAPPQDLAWKPFSIDQPLGLATQAKLARIGADPAACRAALQAGGIAPIDQPVREQAFCSTRDTVRVQSRLSPSAPVMTCPLALRYAVWERQILEPAAERLLDSSVVRVEHLGTYACRTIYGRPGQRPSQHAKASALDVSGVRLDDGRRLTIARDFRKQGPEGRFLRVARAGACELFGAVLGPDYNAAHADHLHLDLGRYRLCR